MYIWNFSQSGRTLGHPFVGAKQSAKFRHVQDGETGKAVLTILINKSIQKFKFYTRKLLFKDISIVKENRKLVNFLSNSFIKKLCNRWKKTSLDYG